MTTTHELPRPRRVGADTLASRLVVIRHELGLSQRAAAQQAGITFGIWQGLEGGRMTRNRDEVVRQIAERLDYDVDWLLWGHRPLGGPSGGVSHG